jgi:uncharacterized OB-fold protein
MSEEIEITQNNYLKYLSEGKLMGSKCKKCGHVDVPARKLCSKCITTTTEWIETSGKGKLAAYSCIHVGTPYFEKKGYNRKKPYCFSIIELDEGPMVSAQLIGVDELNPDETIKIGMPVKVKFLPVNIEGLPEKVDLGFEPV